MSALHYSQISGGLGESEMEETYLYHKLEAMRLVNAKVADPATCTSDGCLSLIAGLALAESGMGDVTAAEAHINGLCTLIDMRHPEEWQHRFYGMLQRIILMAGSYIAASRDPSLVESPTIETDNMTLCSPHPYFTKLTSALLSTAQVQATNLSPFYLTTAPCLEACKADVEGEVLFNTLQRLTSICFFAYDNSNNEITSLLLSDTESYIASLLFQPDSPSSSPTTIASYPKSRHTKKRRGKNHPYKQTPPVYFPSSSRAWAAAGYLYIHLILSPLWTQISQDSTIDTDLLWYLLNTLQDDIATTEEAMKIGTYSSELWIWKVIIGVYAIHLSLRDQHEDVMREVMATTEINQELQEIFGTAASADTPGQTIIWPGLIYTGTSLSSLSFQDGSEDALPDHAYPDQAHEKFHKQKQNHIPAASPPPNDYLHSFKIFFNQKIAIWSQTTKVVDWEGTEQMLGRIVWPRQASAQRLEQTGTLETTVRAIWTEAVSMYGSGVGEVLFL
ncbi:hypothetical protein QBC36DRAFT_301677 [Triangularia setosa]|uniref:Uncharacterized protein n=1 Tax=Triangularia setosa TaxID=2587417 RepID=A0AAN6W609_9PEZI|nr:hypothetical protein QBC36DRAFT_301677 [Podospora setosa]